MDDDITDVPTWAGFLYLAVVLDAFSRRIVGWAMGINLKTQLVLDAARCIVMMDAYVYASRRRKMAERPFAQFKRILRFDRLRLCGLNGARDEFYRAAVA